MRDGYYKSGEHTTSRNGGGYCPARTCNHEHRSRPAAERCAALNAPWIVYHIGADGVWRKADEEAIRAPRQTIVRLGPEHDAKLSAIVADKGWPVVLAMRKAIDLQHRSIFGRRSADMVPVKSRRKAD